MEPESIVTHRKSGNKVQYKVHWRGLGNEEETWVNAEDFLHKGILKVYWTYHLDPNNQPKGSGRRKYVPEYIQQFYRDYIQNPLIEFPDFQPEVEKPRSEKPKRGQEHQQQQQPVMQMMPPAMDPNLYSYQEEQPQMMGGLCQDKSYFDGAQILGAEQDPQYNQLRYKVRLANGNIISLTRIEAFMYIPQQMNSFIDQGIQMR